VKADEDNRQVLVEKAGRKAVCRFHDDFRITFVDGALGDEEVQRGDEVE